jgi:3-hydroxybutyryl-CoA dehydrogenase
MKFIVVANVEQQKEILLKNAIHKVEMIFASTSSELRGDENCDAVFYLKENETIDTKKFPNKPVFINAVIETLIQNNFPNNFSRINGWPGFLNRSKWEIATSNTHIVGKIFEQPGWNIVFVKDEPGLVSARIISMIINEGFFAVAEGISTMQEIDLAMKLGTNYPYGPFEWGKKIGLKNIYHLLHKLSQTDKRYSVAPLLEKKYAEFFTLL